MGEHLRRFGDRSGAGRMEGIEQPDLDVGVGGQRLEHPRVVAHVEIVQQHAHMHPALGSLQQVQGDQAPGRIVVEDEILQIDGVLGLVGKADPTEQRVGAERHQAEAGRRGWIGDLGSGGGLLLGGCIGALRGDDRRFLVFRAGCGWTVMLHHRRQADDGLVIRRRAAGVCRRRIRRRLRDLLVGCRRGRRRLLIGWL
jgi:hypothetical protein